MDSGGTNTSGSMQSSSGGDDQEFDSRPHHHHGSSSLSSPFFINSSDHNNDNINNFDNSLLALHHRHQPPPPPPPQQPPPPAFFDLSSNNYLHSLSDHSQLDSNNPNTYPLPNLDLLKTSKTLRSSDQTPPSTFNLDRPFPRLNNHERINTSRSDHNIQRNSVNNKQNPKKRTRASRRAPTTVLTTDTSNFRQMVQEFTGIPAPPFSATASSSSFSRRLDLFGSGSAIKPPSHHIEPLLRPPLSNPIRPNIQTTNPMFLPFSISSMADSIPAFTSNNYNLISDQHYLNIQQNQVSSLQSGVPSSFEGLNMSHGINDNITTHNNESLSFATAGTSTANHEASRDDNGNSSRRVKTNIGKLNYSASTSSDFHGPGKGELGHVDSWICPSSD